ncbi:MAG: hypothetical protein M5R36_01945 [Deltaproteobacteria bacterium]|nr:hypothetical protein [Deltaproteobacteria bacterium]
MSEPIPRPRTGDNRADIHEYTRLLNDRLSEAIRREPAQWVWMHRRWKKRPEGEAPYLRPDIAPPAYSRAKEAVMRLAGVSARWFSAGTRRRIASFVTRKPDRASALWDMAAGRDRQVEFDNLELLDERGGGAVIAAEAPGGVEIALAPLAARGVPSRSRVRSTPSVLRRSGPSPTSGATASPFTIRVSNRISRGA